MTVTDVVTPWLISSAVVRGERESLVHFWLACPDDVLELLWNGSIGQATREMVAQLTPTTFFPDRQTTLRDQLSQFLQKGFQQPGAAKAVIATFLLSPPGQFKIVNCDKHLPAWLVPSYLSLYETGQSTAVMPAISTQPEVVKPESTNEFNLPVPDFGEFPKTLEQLIGNRLQLNRLLGLSNLFYIDPEDQEIREELLQFRKGLADLLLSADDTALENAFVSDFADRYWALVRSGVQSVPLSGEEENLKQNVKNRLSPELGGGFGKPGAISAFLVAMMLYQPGTMQVEDPDQKLPGWLLSGYKEIFSSAIAS